MKKKVGIIVGILLLVAIIIFTAISYAGNKTLYVGLNVTFSDGIGYGIGDASTSGGGIGIWNFRNYDSTDRESESSIQKELYCLKGLYGETWNTNKNTVVEYNLSYDLENERSKAIQLLTSAGVSPENEVVLEILNDTSGVYKELLWVMENLYIPGKTDKTQFLRKIGIEYNASEAQYEYNPTSEYDYTEKLDSQYWETTLTDSDIKAVQQAVIWYFTNAVLDKNYAFDNRNAMDWLEITTDEGESYTELGNYKSSTGEGITRYDQAQILYNYLIDSANNNADNYSSSGYSKPIEMDLAGLSTNEDGRYEIKTIRNGDNYLTGPIKIIKNNDLGYNITLKITDTNNSEITQSNYTFTDSNGNLLGNDINKLVDRPDGFYISIPKNVAKEINININLNYSSKIKTLWLNGTENGTTSASLTAEQPVLEINEQTQSDSVKFTAVVKEYDLALRKYITKVNGTEVMNARVPNIDLSTLNSGTTATYKHRKDPVLVKKGDIVTYKITVYNEGNKNGYASEITDQLPTGLKYTGENTINSNKNTYNVTYDEKTNKVVFKTTTSNSLNIYENNILDNETLEFTCEVIAEPDANNDKILTNVAWISKAYDSEDGKEIINVGEDRDSRPQTFPSVNKDNIENFRGNSSNKTDLIDSTYFYAGEQDDDDFEKLVIEPVTEITVVKTWNDNNDQDGLRKKINSISVNLLANNEIVDTAELTEKNSWTHKFENLPVKENGEVINYSVTETSTIDGYETTINGFTITNTHIPETTEISVEKIWEDNNNQDGKRPTSINVNLLADGIPVDGKTVTLNDSNEWKHTFTDLPVYSNGNKITYTVSEPTLPEGYTKEITGDAINGFVITNNYTPEVIEIPVTKQWEDSNNQDGKRPTEITVQLYANGEEVSGKTATLNSENSWSYTFTNLPKKSEGKDITYTISEPTLPEGYTNQITGNETSGFIITNSYTPETIEIPVTKTWNDNNNQDGKRPTEIKITLYADDAEKEAIILSEMTNGWKYTFKNLPKYANGKEIVYKVEETTVPEEYTSEQTGNIIDGITITNTHIPETTQISVEKRWEDNNNQDGTRPTSIDVNLLADGKPVDGKTVTLNDSNEWKHTFTDLPVYSNGKKIVYTVSEPTLSEGYTNEITGNQEDGFVIINKYMPELIEIPVTKQWEDSNNQDGKRPTEITVQLYANGEVSGKTATLNSENGWKYTFTNLPKKSEGKDIIYTISEPTLSEGYTNEITGDIISGFIITNSYTPETIEIPVTKIWNDNDNQDGKRPANIKITLYADDEEKEVITLSGDTNEWKHTFTNLPKYANGKEIVYKVEETGVPQGYTSEQAGNVIDGITITNTYIPEKIQIPVKKIWVDNNNQDGIRPNSIEVILKANNVEKERITLSGDTNEWTHTFSNLPKYENGKEIVYTVEEEGVIEEYTSVISGSVTIGFTITNTYTPGKTSIRVTKVWDDNNNQDGLRPDSVSVSLIANGDESNPVQTIELNEKNEWTYTFTNLPEKENGEYIQYTIIENTKIEGYTTVIKNNNVSSTSGNIQKNLIPDFIITNEHKTDLTSIKVTKIWNDDNDADKIRPTEITVNLKNGDNVIDTVVLNKENNWTYIFENLPKNENGVEINYTVEEASVPTGYEVTITGNMTEGYTITNTHTPNKIFDLALRKYITKINNNELSTLGLHSRVPKIELNTLKTGTTATYKHQKDPVKVLEGDIVTYQVTIYNEGDKAGYASQIIDQLPEGLIYNPNSTVVSKDASGNNKNTYEVTYESVTNRIIFDIVNTQENPAKDLEAYSDGKLDYETIEIKCKVTYKAEIGQKNILTNVAWINKAYNTVDSKEIINIGDDRDSEPQTKPNVNKDNMEDYKGKDSNKDDLTSSDYFYEGQQDDDDFEKIYVKTFDLALRKFITFVNGEQTESSREPVVDVTPLKDRTGTTSIYKHSKIPVSLKIGDIVVYTIRVYNEGEVAGYANEVKDYLPANLMFLENSAINKKYGWTISEDGRIATTTYLSTKEISEFDGAKLDYEDIQIECKISNNAIPDERITNIAEISEYKYNDTVVPKDLDSESDNMNDKIPNDEELPDYKKEQEKDEYVPGNEDDDDFEKVYVKEFDLALRKFITKVQEKDVTTREPQVKYEDGKISYEHTKEPITLHVGDIVIYTLRIYNEGEIDGYASEISDDIPEYLEYLPEESTNVEYKWKMYDENGNETSDINTAVKVKTDYLSKENGEENLLKAFDGETLYYKDIKIAFKVKDPNSNSTIITNYAQISNDTDKDGNPIKDKDSEPDEWNDGEDDQDIENVKVEYFDLALVKYVSKVIVQEDGQEKITQTGYNGLENPEPVVKVELNKKKLDKVVVKFGYGIRITNEGDIPGYATEITDYVPEGLRFDSADNPNWTDEGNNIISTKQLENTLLQPGESATVEVILTWINGADNLALKTNTVEISDDNNEYGVPDRDSTPDNKKDGEDDIDIAKVILAISTGSGKTYFILTIGLLVTIGIGVILIKKFVI